MTQPLSGTLDLSIPRQSGWERVRAEFLERARSELTQQQMRILENMDIENVQSEIKALLKDHRSSKLSKFIVKLQPFLRTIDSFSRALGVFSNAERCAAIAFRIVQIAFQMGNFALERIGSAAGQLLKLSKILNRLQRTEEAFPGQPKVLEALEAAYGDIFSFYLRVVQHIRKESLFKRIMRSAQNFEKFCNVIIESLETNLKHLDAEIRLVSIAVYQRGRSEPLNQNIFLVPDIQRQDFIGRNAILENLETFFDRSIGSDSALRIAWLYGAAGVGKSGIAQEYTHTRRSRFHWVIWISADTAQKLYSGFRTIATQLGISSECCADKTWMINEVKVRLSTTAATWLLIFDNADDINLIDEYWPFGGNGHIIITTRDCLAPEKFSGHKIFVSGLSVGEGIHFLKTLVHKEHPSWPELDEGSNYTAIDLVREIGALPIALYHAAAALEAGRPIEDLLLQYRDPTQNKLLLEIDRAQISVLGRASETPYEKLKSTDQRGDYALQLLAWTDHDGIQKDFFRYVKFFPDEEMLFPTDASYQAAIHELTRSRRVTSSVLGDTLFANRMVQVAEILSMTHEERIKTFSSIAALLESRFPQPYTSEGAIFPGVVQHVGECQKLISHVLSLVKNYECYLRGEKINRFGSLLQRAALYLLEIDNRQGERLLQMSLDMEWTDPEEGHVVPHIQMNLAWNFMRRGDLVKAKSLGSASISLFESVLDHGHVLTAWAYCNFGRIHAFDAKFDEARLYHQKAINIYENELRTDPQNIELVFALFIARNYLVTATHCQIRENILGDIYEPSIHSSMGPALIPILTEEVKERLEEPLALCMAGLVLANKEYASVFPNKQTLAWIELTLCWILLDLEHFGEAKKYNLLALKHVKDRFSPNGCGVGVVTVQRADILNATGKVAEAEEAYRKARNMLEEKMGLDDPLTALAYHKTGNFHCRHNRFADAVHFYQIALESFRKSYGESHPTTATTMNNLGIAFINIGQKEPGLKLLKEALETRKKRFPSSHKLILRLATNIEFLESRSNRKPEEDGFSKDSDYISEVVIPRVNSVIDSIVNTEHIPVLPLLIAASAEN